MGATWGPLAAAAMGTRSERDITRRVKQTVTLLWAPYNFPSLPHAKSSARNTFFQNMKHNISCSLHYLKRGNVVHNFTFIAYF